MTENFKTSFLSSTLGKPVFHVESSISVEYSDIRKLLSQTIIYLHPQIFGWRHQILDPRTCTKITKKYHFGQNHRYFYFR